MALVAGTVSVSATEVVSGSGLARAIYDAEVATTDLPPQDVSSEHAGWDDYKAELQEKLTSARLDQRVSTLRGIAKKATALASALVPYFTTNAEISLATVVATVSPTTSTGRTPNPNDPDTAIQGPAVAVTLPVARGDAAPLRIA